MLYIFQSFCPKDYTMNNMMFITKNSYRNSIHTLEKCHTPPQDLQLEPERT